MLLQIRDYILRQNVVSLKQLSREFQTDEQALQPMLAIWLAKGLISQTSAQCGKVCGGCKVNADIVYSAIAV